MASTAIEYCHIDEVEPLERYRLGGYHKINIGDELHSRYRILYKLGFGSYSTTWLARDAVSQKLVAVKVGIANSGLDEAHVLSALTTPQKHISDSPGRGMIRSIRDQFYIHGANGTYPCYVMAPAKASLSNVQIACPYRMFQLDVARALAAQLTVAVGFAHSQGVVHADIHLSNVLLHLPSDIDKLSDEQLRGIYGPPRTKSVVRFDGQEPAQGVPPFGILPLWLGERSDNLKPSEAKIVLIDFGQAFRPSLESKYNSCAPASMKPPEARFEPNRQLSFPSDVWLLACAIWSILCQRPLFEPYLTEDDESTREYVDALGILPPEWWHLWEARREWFNDDGTPLDHRTDAYRFEDRFEYSTQRPRREEGMVTFEQDEKDALFAMLRSMLSYKPEDRITAAEVLESEWMEKWAMPEYEKIRDMAGP